LKGSNPINDLTPKNRDNTLLLWIMILHIQKICSFLILYRGYFNNSIWRQYQRHCHNLEKSILKIYQIFLQSHRQVKLLS